MKRTFLPLVGAHLVIMDRGKTTFHINNKKLIVEAPNKLMQQLVQLSKGRLVTKQIVELLKNKWDENSLWDLIKELRRQGILISGTEASEWIWDLVENPIGFPPHLDEVTKNRLVERAKQRHREKTCGIIYRATQTAHGDLLERRKSIRSFSGKVSFQSIINMLWSCYGEIENKRRTVPSAGALYPLKLHIALLQHTEELAPGIYHIRFGPNKSVGFKIVSSELNRFRRSFVDPIMLKDAHGVIVISGSFHITAEKYGSRSISFVILEAGHAAQNINLAGVEHGIATVEIGGFKEKPLREAIALEKHYHPLLTTAFGCENREWIPASQKIEVQWQTPTDNQLNLSFAIASARVSKNRDWSHGRDASPELAYTKALSEAKEWAACSNIPNNLIHTTFAGLETAIDPRSIIKFHPTQYRLKGFPFKPFDEATAYSWAEGYDELEGSRAHILADHTYFPYFPKTPYYCYANSSGVAAHPNRHDAVETGTLELIERDSFMIAYLAQLQFPTIREKTLPESIRKRIQELRKVGFRVWIKDHSIDLAPVVHIIAKSEKLECTTCASCSSFDTEHAISHALMEVEASVLARIQNGPVESIKPKEVKWPLDHGRLYEQKRYFHKADFMIDFRNQIMFKDMGMNVARSWKELLKRFSVKKWRLFTVSLHLSEKYGGNGNLHIIRSIIPGLVPMTFGFRQEPGGMERIYVIAKKFGNYKLSYQKLNKFPHPFA